MANPFTSLRKLVSPQNSANRKKVVDKFDASSKLFSLQVALAHTVICAQELAITDISFLYSDLTAKLNQADEFSLDLKLALKNLIQNTFTCLPIIRTLLDYVTSRNNLKTLSIDIPSKVDNDEDVEKLSKYLIEFLKAAPSKLEALNITLAPGSRLTNEAITAIVAASSKPDSKLKLTLKQVPIPISLIGASNTQRLELIDCPKVTSPIKQPDSRPSYI